MCLSVHVICTAQTDGPVLMKLSTNHLLYICSIRFSSILKIGTQASIDMIITLVKFHELLKSGSKDMRRFYTDRQTDTHTDRLAQTGYLIVHRRKLFVGDNKNNHKITDETACSMPYRRACLKRRVRSSGTPP